MFVLFMKWGVVGAKDKLDTIHIIKGEFHPIWNLHRVLPTHRIL